MAQLKESKYNIFYAPENEGENNERGAGASFNAGIRSDFGSTETQCVNEEETNPAYDDSTGEDDGPDDEDSSGADENGRITLTPEMQARMVGAVALWEGGAARRQCDVPMIARKMAEARTPFVNGRPEPNAEMHDEIEETVSSEEQNVPPTAFCLETGEHVEINQMEFATAHPVDVSDAAEQPGATNSDLKRPEFIPSAPEFVIRREGPTKEVVDSLLRNPDHGDSDAAASGSTAVTLITGMGGLGKSVIASVAVSTPAVLESFDNNISWLSLGPTKLTPVSYRNSLLKLCSHVLVHDEQYELVRSKLGGFPFEIEKSDEFVNKEFKDLKEIVEPFLVGRKLLIVLDDVWHDDDISSFAFGKDCHIVVTSRKKDLGNEDPSSSLLNVSSIDICLPNEDESILLLEKVSGLSFREDNDICSNADGREILRRCHFLPLSVVSIGLLMKGCSNFSPVKGNKILESLDPAGGGDIDQVNVHSSCYHIFDQSFRSLDTNNGVGASLRLCFAAFCACFININGGRVSVPLSVVRNFFDDLLAGHGSYLTVDEQSEMKRCGIGALQVIEKLRSVGFLDQLSYHPQDHCGDSQHHLVVHHDLQREYGVKAAVVFEESKKKSHFGILGLPRFKEHPRFEQAQARANMVVVENFERRASRKSGMVFSKQRDWSNVKGNDRMYMLEFLPTHMFLADQHSKALNLSIDEPFLSSRIESFGLKKCQMIGMQELRFAGQAILEKNCSAFFWFKGESAYDRAVISNLIGATPEERDTMYRDYTIAKVKFFLNSAWVMNLKAYVGSSPLWVVVRRMSSIHHKKMFKMLCDSGLKNHLFALNHLSTYLHLVGDIERCLKVRLQYIALCQEVYPGEELYGQIDLLLVYILGGRYKESIAAGQDVLCRVKSNYGESSDSVEVATATAILGVCHQFACNTEDSQKLFLDARDMYTRTGYSGEGFTYVNLQIKGEID